MKANIEGGVVEAIDVKGRPVRFTRASDGSIVETYYIGRDCEGVIKYEGDREYIVFNGEKRYWGGIIDSLPNDPRIKSLNEFAVFIIKPDGMRMELGKSIRYLIAKSKGAIVAERDFVYNDTTIRKMYPHFFTEEWEQILFDYLKSGTSRCFLVTGEHSHRRMFSIRNAVRHLFGYDDQPRVENLVHCTRRQSDAIREALLFFSLGEIVTSVGLKSK